MEEIFIPIAVVGMLFIGLPWIVLHYVTKWRQAPKITDEDERLLDELYNHARRLDERLGTIERIIAADNPDWTQLAPRVEQPDFDLTRRN
ncbi:envelope stress response membrane protein PspB [Sphingomonas sp.]|uniref:envelope stress response membrane protein PspB n=1 Tax=Sphingomonas sp. TaxID=28214 RepID=UPI001D482AB0|nr:envelope stress response membrane protein PspB [Sphingomonas sp.]MBX9796374.1 envelope stress response membrane protein PspB [Sphingomonas sp.]